MTEAAVTVSDTILERSRRTKQLAILGAVVNLLLAIVKLLVGLLAHSSALIADGFHSLSDLISDGMVYLAAKHSAKAADQDHPYGHARIETALTVGLGLLLWMVAAAIIYDGVNRMLHPQLLLVPGPAAVAVAILSIAANEWLYHYTMLVARKVRSELLKANAWHHRTDSISSLIVVVGLVGAQFGLDYLDAVASVLVAVMIILVGWQLVWRGLGELVDKGLAPERLATIRSIISGVAGVEDMHLLRTRQMGGDALVDVHIQVQPHLSVSEGHQISEFVRQMLLSNVDEVTDVTVHIDPEDDAIADLTARLPLREQILPRLHDAWRPLLDIDRIDEIILHYVGGTISVDLILPLDVLREDSHPGSLAERINAASTMSEVKSIRVLYH